MSKLSSDGEVVSEAAEAADAGQVAAERAAAAEMDRRADDRAAKIRALAAEVEWPDITEADEDDMLLAIGVAASGGVAMYGNFLNAVLAGIYAERTRAAKTGYQPAGQTTGQTSVKDQM